MTEISFNLYDSTYIFECKGHTGYSARGSDILCSAVSVLCYTLKDLLEDMEAAGRIYRLICDFHDGMAIIEFSPASEKDISLLEAVEALLRGFRILGEGYPEYITADV